jgi:hypothetical protein
MRAFAALISLALVASGSAEEYLVEYDPSAGLFPEQEGWQRVWGDEQGPYHGSGADRSFEDGALVLDTLYDPGVVEFYSRSGLPTGPEAGEMFFAEWRVRVEDLVGSYAFSTAIFSEYHTAVAFDFTTDSMYVTTDPSVGASFAPGVFHTFTLRSSDMVTYQVEIDGAAAFWGSFHYSSSMPKVNWGEGVSGYASRCAWEYYRFGCVPEPGAAAMLLIALACVGRVRIARGRVARGIWRDTSAQGEK